ncbi:MAG: DUF58 domain-containing protein [Lentisphaerae bacterium]|nr:DUF58 domain-containing protein [Lentisphaerota bacterium]
MQVVELVSNHRRTPVPWLKSELAVSPHLRFEGASTSHTDRLQLVSGIFSLHSHHQLRREWHVTATRFGRQGISKALLVSTDLLGRLTLSTAIPVGVSVTVLPKPYNADAFPWEQRQLFGELAIHRRYIPDPFMPSGVLPYTGYEPLRDIHWYASAQQQELMVRDYQDSTSQSVAVILNLEKRTIMDRFASTNLDYEAAIRLSATCFDMTLAEGLPVEFIVNGRFLHDRQILPAEQQSLDMTGRYEHGQEADYHLTSSSNPRVQSATGSKEGEELDFLSVDADPTYVKKEDEPVIDYRLQGTAKSYYRSKRESGREHVQRLFRILAWLEPGAASPLAPLLAQLEHDLTATDVLLLSQYVDESILTFCTVLNQRGIRLKLGLLAKQNEDSLVAEIASRNLAELIPLYSLAGKLPDPAEVK